jgi:hypothetical protein
VPSELDAARLPTRLGYVVRCSKTEAVHEAGRTFLLQDGARVELEAPTPGGMAELRRRYAEENRTAAPIDYGADFRFSMNAGDYRAPIYEASDEFRIYDIPTRDDRFAELSASARLEELGKGRRGAVLVATDGQRGVPIVRTTTAYTLPAQRLSARPHRARAADLRVPPRSRSPLTTRCSRSTPAPTRPWAPTRTRRSTWTTPGRSPSSPATNTPRPGRRGG